MTNSEKTIRINAIIDIRTDTLQTIVSNEKEAADYGKSGTGPIDTAGKVGELISRFLRENDFHSFALDPVQYKKQD